MTELRRWRGACRTLPGTGCKSVCAAHISAGQEPNGCAGQGWPRAAKFSPRPAKPDRLLALTLLLCLASLCAHAAPRIGLVTIDPGLTYWVRLGHNANLVAPEDGQEPTLYQYGYFAFDEPNGRASRREGVCQYV